jgi:YfiH family protein
MLPQPNDEFTWVQASAGSALVCRPLSALAPHLFTTREWPLGASVAGADDEAAWAEVARAIDVDALVRVRQVHGASAVRVRIATTERRHADIMVTAEPALGLAVQAADCVPLLIADRRTGAVAAAHAGWRGLAARVPSVTLEVLAREFDSRPSDLVAAIGPSIGACCYEVGPDVRDRFAEAGFSGDRLTRWFLHQPAPTARNPSLSGIRTDPRRDRWFFDAWASALEQLEDSGVPVEQIFVAELCTASHPDAFSSYRRDGPPAGRLAGAIRCAPRHP